MANNNLLYNAALNGAIAAISSRWITATDYSTQLTYSVAFAEEVDSQIAFNPEMNSVGGSQLLGIICGSFWTDRDPQFDDPEDYEDAAIAIVALFLEAWDAQTSSLGQQNSPIALWVYPERQGLVLGDTLIGYTAEQIADNYDGDPAVTLSGLGNNGGPFTVLYDGTIVLSNADAGTYYYIVPPNLQTTQVLSASMLRLVPAISSNTNLAFQLDDGGVFLCDTATATRYTLQEFYSGREGIAITGLDTPVTGDYVPNGCVDAGGQLWLAFYGQDSIVRYTKASLAVAGAAASDKIATGSAFGAVSAIVFDALGGLWHIDADSGTTLVYHDAATIAALNNTPSNPAATRTLTGLTGLWNGLVLDRDGGAWVADYGEAQVHYLTAAQLLAGGAQTPTRTIQTPLHNISTLRMSSPAGLFLI